MPRKTYFLAPTRDTPLSGPIFLGAIIKSPRSPELPLNSKTSPLLQTLEIHETITTDTTRQIYRDSKGKVGLYAEFLSSLPLGLDANVGTNWDNRDFEHYKFKELVTRSIFPSQGEVAAIFAEPIIQASIKDSRFRDNLYMITGIKIAKGADVLIGKVRERGGNLHFGGDLTPVSVPIKIGPDLEGSRGRGQNVEENHAGEFVFAYRLREIRYRRKAVKEQREYLEGDLLGHGQKKKEEIQETKGEAELIGINEMDVDSEEVEEGGISVLDDDGDETNCIIWDDEE